MNLITEYVVKGVPASNLWPGVRMTPLTLADLLRAADNNEEARDTDRPLLRSAQRPTPRVTVARVEIVPTADFSDMARVTWRNGAVLDIPAWWRCRLDAPSLISVPQDRKDRP